MEKTFVLDISTLLTSPYSLLSFDDNHVIILKDTLNQLREAALLQTEHGSNARQVLSTLDELQTTGNLWESVPLPGGGSLSLRDNVCRNGADPITDFCLDYEYILVSSNSVQRLLAMKSGVVAQDFQTDTAKTQYNGRREMTIPDKYIDQFYSSQKHITASELDFADTPPVMNEFFVLRSDQDVLKTALARFDGNNLVPLVYGNTFHPFGVEAKNVGQKFAIEALMMPADVAPLVLLIGPAGTAKTFLSMAAGLEQILNSAERPYRRILAVRPNAIMDKEIGFLPGDERSKVSPLFRPIFDNLETLTSADCGKGKNSKGIFATETGYADTLIERGDIEMQALGYMRGRSISDTYIVLDEMQNSSPIQAFGLVSRPGEGTKIIMCGDSEQIDNPQLDRLTNGLMYTNDRMKGSPLCWTVTFTKEECVRSKLAMEAISRMAPKGIE